MIGTIPDLLVVIDILMDIDILGYINVLWKKGYESEVQRSIRGRSSVEIDLCVCEGGRGK